MRWYVAAAGTVAALTGIGFVLGMEYASRVQREAEGAQEDMLRANTPEPDPGYGPGRTFWTEQRGLLLGRYGPGRTFWRAS